MDFYTFGNLFKKEEKHMRRRDREVKDFSEIVEIIKMCDVCRLALNDDGYPYIVPLNFGMEVEGEKIYLYFHGALKGRKIDLIEKDNRASFEMDCEHELQYCEEKGDCSFGYASVIGRGHIKMLNEDEKMEALRKLMDHYHPSKNAYFNPAAISRTAVFMLEVEEISGKRKAKRKM